MSSKRHSHSSSLRLLFIESVADFGGGSERVSHDLAINLSRLGHRVFFAVPHEGTALASLREAGVHCIIADIGPLPLSRPLLSLRRWFSAASLVSRISPDHTFTSVSYLAPLLGSLQAAFGHASAVHLGLVLDDVPPTLRWAMRLGVLGIAPSVWAMNAWSQRGWPSARLACVSNGVNLNRFRPRDDERASLRARFDWNEDEVVIVFIGRLTPEKGVPTLVRAFAAVSREAPKARLALFGHASGEVINSLRTLGKVQGLSDVFWNWHGPTSEPECILAAADIAVVASETPETFGLSVVESMACACPVIVSDVSLFPELVGLENRHLVFNTASPSSLAAALNALVTSSSEQRQQLGQSLRERVATCFPLEQTVAGYLALFMKNSASSSCLQ